MNSPVKSLHCDKEIKLTPTVTRRRRADVVRSYAIWCLTTLFFIRTICTVCFDITPWCLRNTTLIVTLPFSLFTNRPIYNKYL